ncbi:hypothetical protein HK104_004493 [Borealophlyctis nickersoniae]|nr:hypothetical protein HK104_004493 [Borealophlyctis nickersoniae]
MRRYKRTYALTVLVVRFLVVNGATYRSFNGTNNNQKNPEWGSALTPFLYVQTKSAYADGFFAPAGADRPSARWISDTAMSIGEIQNEEGVPDMLAFWGQFVAHDLLDSETNHSASFNIPVPCNDSNFDPTGTCTAELSFHRLRNLPNSTTVRLTPNHQTAWIDCSHIYGASDERAALLREFSGGLLRGSLNDLYLPTVPKALKDTMLGLSPDLYFAGDPRANENPALLSLHTVFLREHNRRARYYASLYPTYNDETLFQMARAWLIACMQKITYREYLPKLLGGPLPAYTGYNDSVDPGIDTMFFSSCFRYGHSAINKLILRLDENWNEHRKGHLLLRNVITNPMPVIEDGVEPILRGMVAQLEQISDISVVEDLRNFMPAAPFDPTSLHAYFDLAAFNIQRGRFNDISSDPKVQAALSAAYNGDVTLVDPYVGGLAEDREGTSLVGPLLHRSIVEQFTRIRDGDAFWYERAGVLSANDTTDLANVTLSNLILWNTNISTYPSSAFSYASSDVIATMRGLTTSTDSTTSTNSSTQRVQLTTGLALTYKVDATGGTINFQLESNYSGWFAFGIGSGMANADIMAVYDHGGDTWLPDDRWGSGYVEPPTDVSLGGTNDLQNVVTVNTTFSKRAVSWTRKLTTGDTYDKAISKGSLSIIWAYSDSSATLAYHGSNKGIGQINFFSGVDTDTATDVALTVCATHGPSSVFIIIHAVEMLANIFVIIPLGIYVARYGTRVDLWLPWHQYLMGIVTAEFAWTIRGAITMGADDGYEWGLLPFTHAKIGLVGSIYGILIGILGWFARQDFRFMAKFQSYIRSTHRVGALLLYMLVIFNGYLGVKDLAARYGSTSDVWQLLYFSYFGFLFLLFFGGKATDRYWRRWLRVALDKGHSLLHPNDDPPKRKPVISFANGTEVKEPTRSISYDFFVRSCEEGASWTLIAGMVCDVSEYIEQHPGGPKAIRAAIGKDATLIFQGKDKIQGLDVRNHAHSRFATNKLSDMIIGKLQAEDLPSSKGSIEASRSRMSFEVQTRRRSMHSKDIESAPSEANKSGQLHAAWRPSVKMSSPQLDRQGVTNSKSSWSLFSRRNSGTPAIPIAIRKSRVLSDAIPGDVANVTSAEGPQHMPIMEKGESRVMGERSHRRAKLVEKQTVTGFRARNPVRKFRIKFQGDPVELTPGDALTITMPDKSGEKISKKYTPTRATLEGYFDLYIKIYSKGSLTPLIDEMELGTDMIVEGPMQHSIQSLINESIAHGCHEEVVMFAAGTGITPMLQLIDYYLRNCPRNTSTQSLCSRMSLLWANRSEDDIFLSSELLGMERAANSSLRITHMLSAPSPEWTGLKGAITTDTVLSMFPETFRAICTHPTSLETPAVVRVTPLGSVDVVKTSSLHVDYNWNNLLILVCGPPGFNELTMSILKNLGIPESIVIVL